MSMSARAIMAASQAGGTPPGPSLPIDWSTDILFARASAATHFEAPTLTRYPSGSPRILGDGSLYVEGSRTNKFHNSSTYSSLGSATAIDNSDTNPAGDVTTADQITIIGASGRVNIDTGTSMTAGQISASTFVKYVDGEDQARLLLAGAAGVGASIVGFTTPVDWGRQVSVLTTSQGGALQLRISENGVLNNNVFLAWGHQAEDGGFASQHIETSGAAGTRLADEAVIEDADVPAAMRLGAWQITIKPRRASTQANDTITDTLFAFGAGLDNRISINASNQVVVRQGGTDRVTTGALTWSADQAITLTFDAAAGTAIVAGATTGNGTTTGTAWTMPTGDVQVGNDAALGTAFFGAISPPEAP